MEYSKLYSSVEKLKEETTPKWGRMNSSMMLKHCSAFIDVYLNKRKLNPLIFIVGFVFGIFHRLYLKYIVRYNVKNYIKNLPTLKVFNTYRCENLDFEYEKNIAEINRKLTGIETLFFLSDSKYSFISSSIVRELILNKGDYSLFVPNAVKNSR